MNLFEEENKMIKLSVNIVSKNLINDKGTEHDAH